MSLLREPGATRPEWAPARSSGAIDTLIIRAANRWHANRTHEENRMARKPRTEADEKFFALRESGYTGPITQDGEKATPANTDPRLLETLAAVHNLPSWDSYEPQT